LTQTATEVAAGLADWLNSSDTRNQGMEPGPVANMITKKMTSTMLKYEIHNASLCKKKIL
jgi:hypothetical protein